jgi:excisionase family DNA binding protein
MSTPKNLDHDPDEYDLRAHTPEQVAELLGVSTRTIRRMVAAGQLKPIQVWGMPRFTSAAIRAFLARADKGYRPRQRSS